MTDATASDRQRTTTSGDLAPLFGIPGVIVRRLLWAGYIAVLAFFVLARTLPGSSAAWHLAGQSLWTAIAVLTAGALWMAHVRTVDAEGSFWGYLAAGAGCIAAGELYFTVYIATVSAAGPPLLSPSTVLDVVAGLVFAAMLGTFARFRHASVAARARYVVDVVAACVVGAGALEIWVVGPWLDGFGPNPAWVRLIYSATPVFGLLLLGCATWLILGTRLDRWEPWERLIAGAIASFALGLVLAPVAYADLTWHIAGGVAREAVDLVWLTGLYLGMAAAVYRHLGLQRRWRLRPLAILEPAYGWLPSVVLPTVQTLAIPVFGIAALAGTDPSSRNSRLVVAGVTALALALHELLTIADTDTLVAGAVTDPLTGLHNHRHFQESLAAEIASAARYGENVGLIVLDIDEFRHLNSLIGHGAGDVTLVEVSRAVERVVRLRDVVSRVGGDEIAIILPGADVTSAFSVALRVLSEVRAVPGQGAGSLTASAGVACFPAHATDRDELVKRAEGAQYWSKTHGKDRATVYDPDIVVALDAEARIVDLRQRADVEAVRALAAAVDARDEETQDHSRNVARHAVTLAREIGLDDHTVLLIEFAGLLHDVGKIAVPDAVLRKQGALNASERARMEAHAILGEQILSSTSMREILPWVRNHHERWDGEGYPDGLAGEDIPLGARIIAIANAYDAMRSPRAYRAPLSRSAALQEIDLGLGTRFDPSLGERFIGVIGRRYV